MSRPAIVLLSSIVWGCGGLSPQVPAVGNLTATVQSDVVTSMTVAAIFTTAAARPGRSIAELTISAGDNASRARGQRIVFHRLGVDHVPRGRYTLGSITGEGLARAGLEAIYFESGDAFDAFVAQEGAVDIEVGTQDLVKGSFSFSASQYCHITNSVSPVVEGSCQASVVAPNAKRLTVSGTFTAPRGNAQTTISR